MSSLPGVEFGRLHYRHLERDKIQALRRSQGVYEILMHLSEAAKYELNWLLDFASHLCRRVKQTLHINVRELYVVYLRHYLLSKCD